MQASLRSRFQRSFVWAPDATRADRVVDRRLSRGQPAVPRGGSTRFKARTAEEAPESQRQPSYLILDGQQRLTSLYQALFGVGQSRFFLDVGGLLAGAEVDEGVRVLPADRVEALSAIEAQASALLMPLSRVRTRDSIRWIDSVVKSRR